jgi:hypothetical protein
LFRDNPISFDSHYLPLEDLIVNIKRLYVSLPLACAALLLTLGCAANRIKITPIMPAAVKPVMLGEGVAIYISPIYLRKVHTQVLDKPGKVVIELGEPLSMCAESAFQPFFGKVLLLGANETSSLPYHVDVRNEQFSLQPDLSADIQIWCKVTGGGKTLLQGSYTGHGSSLSDTEFKRQETTLNHIKNSSEMAFQDAFNKIRIALLEKAAPK